MDKEQYEKMCAELENSVMYDGRGTYDLYRCESCSNEIFTTYKDKGVTPMIINCRKCGRYMEHVRTFAYVADGIKIHEWYRPQFFQFQKLSKELKQHIREGGLVLDCLLKNSFNNHEHSI